MTVALPVEDLRAYLRDLKPEARALLVAEIERGRLRGMAFPGADLVLQELRPVLRTAREQPARIDNPVRLFFKPLDPFIIDGRFEFAVTGRVHRSSLGPLWNWISRDLAPDAAKSYADDVAAALLAGEHWRADRLAEAFQDFAASAMRDVLGGDRDEKAQRRLLAQIGIPRALEEVQLVAHLLADREALAKAGAKLAPTIAELEGEALEGVLRVLVAPAVRSRPEMRLSALVLVKNRLRSFWELPRLGVRSADTDVAARVEKSPLGAALWLVLADLRCMNEELRRAVKEARFQAAVALVRMLHDAVRALRTEIDFSADCAASRELGALRAAASDLLGGEIRDVPALVRRLLRVVPGQGSGAKLDPATVGEAEGRIELVAACRSSAGELALNQMAPRIHAELQNALDNATQRLLEHLRKAQGAERDATQTQVGAALRFSGRLFGAEHAAQLAKAAILAGADPKLVRG